MQYKKEETVTVTVTEESRERYVKKLLDLSFSEKIALGKFFGRMPEDANSKAYYIVKRALTLSDIHEDIGSRVFDAAFFVATYVGKTRITSIEKESAASVIGQYVSECRENTPWIDIDSILYRFFDSRTKREFMRRLTSLLVPAAKEARTFDLSGLMYDLEHWSDSGNRASEVQRRWVRETVRAEEEEES